MVISKQQNKNYCDINQDCNQCSICGKDNNNYCSCNINNTYCYSGYLGNYSLIAEFLYSFDGCMTGNRGMENICGSSNIDIDIGINKTVNFISTSMLDYFCFYNVKKIRNNNNDILISIKKEGYIPITFNMHLVIYDNNNKVKISSWTNLINDLNIFEIVELEAEKISVYVHIPNGNNMGKISINFSIKDTIIKKITYTTNSTINKGLIFGIIGGTVFLIIIIITICLIRRNRNKSTTQSDNSTSNNQIVRTPSNLDQIKKNTEEMNKLFKSELSPSIYYKKKAVNDCYSCTICLEDFKDGSSVIVTTKCKHSFHFNCFKNWVFKNITNSKCPNCNNPILKSDIDILSNVSPI